MTSDISTEASEKIAEIKLWFNQTISLLSDIESELRKIKLNLEIYFRLVEVTGFSGTKASNILISCKEKLEHIMKGSVGIRNLMAEEFEAIVEIIPEDLIDLIKEKHESLYNICSFSVMKSTLDKINTNDNYKENKSNILWQLDHKIETISITIVQLNMDNHLIYKQRLLTQQVLGNKHLKENILKLINSFKVALKHYEDLEFRILNIYISNEYSEEQERKYIEIYGRVEKSIAVKVLFFDIFIKSNKGSATVKVHYNSGFDCFEANINHFSKTLTELPENDELIQSILHDLGKNPLPR